MKASKPYKCRVHGEGIETYLKNSYYGYVVCKICADKRSREYYKNNKEKSIAATMRWNKENKEKVSAYRRTYFERNKEKIDLYSKKWSDKNPGYRKMYMKKYYEKNREKINENRRLHHLKNREQILSRKKEKREEDKMFISLGKEMYELKTKKGVNLVFLDAV